MGERKSPLGGRRRTESEGGKKKTSEWGGRAGSKRKSGDNVVSFEAVESRSNKKGKGNSKGWSNNKKNAKNHKTNKNDKRRSHLVIKFDADARKEFITGFRKRKLERQATAKKEIETKSKEQRRMDRKAGRDVFRDRFNELEKVSAKFQKIQNAPTKQTTMTVSQTQTQSQPLPNTTTTTSTTTTTESVQINITL